MQLSAQQRYATLQVMGTRLWVPRFQLQGAAASSVCDWPAPAKQLSARERLLQQQALAAPSSSATAPVTPTPQQPPIASPLPTNFQAPPVKLPPQPLVQQQATQPVAALLPLQANVWLLANGWQLVLENTNGSLGLQEVDVRLLHNLLIALYPGGLGIITQQVFSWPLPGVPVAVGDEGELSMALQAFLTGARLQGVQLGGCLVFGERLFNLMNNNINLPRLFASPSLAELQQNPAAKQAFWQQAGSSGLRAAFASSPVTF
ncbi:MAG: hypothetical protein GX029_00250 [Pseudomonadaceae bacterium]|nr:hypothetical protein [Pseudomonadaceae bacterium]